MQPGTWTRFPGAVCGASDQVYHHIDLVHIKSRERKEGFSIFVLKNEKNKSQGPYSSGGKAYGVDQFT